MPATDLAGNVGQSPLSQPIMMGSCKPKVLMTNAGSEER